MYHHLCTCNLATLSRVYTCSRELFSRHFCKEVPTGRVTVGMASLYLESLRGVHAHLKPLQASVEVSTEHAPPTGLYVEVSHVHCNSSCWNFLAKESRELFSRAGITAALKV